VAAPGAAGSPLNRRGFLAGALSLGAALGLPGASRSQGRHLATGNVVSLGAVRRLIAERVDPLLGRCRYVADVGGRRVAQPILLARRGERLDAAFENALPQPTTLHFHGLTLAESQDGAGFDPVAPGTSRRLGFELRNRSGLYWFHPHPHGLTAEQVYAGLAGLLVVIDEDDLALDRALGLGPRNRLALALADVRLAQGLLRPYAPRPAECLHGWLGNRATANGLPDAAYEVRAGWVRLQLLNACNARGLLLAFREGKTQIPFHLVGTDGGLLGAPRELERVFLHPAERVDVVVNASGRARLDAVSLEFDPRERTGAAHARHAHRVRERHAPLAAEAVCEERPAPPAAALPDGAELALFSLQIDGRGAARVATLPARLSALAEAAAWREVPVRRMRLDFSEQEGFLIDQTPYRSDEIAFSVERGSREVWEIKNSPISAAHPMHLHGFGFRVLRRQGTFGPARALATEGGGRLPTDLGVKDTVTLWPNETVWLGVDFALPQDAEFRGRQRYMFHCHNLEHEDAMMMRNFAVL
jgi:FtsP/CotA-like multicopper oxidase with cupredoxin domain